MKVYIAGPMRGIPKLNFPAFDQAQKLWISHGHEPVSPASIDRAFGYDGSCETLLTKEFTRRAIAVDCQILFFCDALALLPGWQASRGSTVELALAQFLDLPIFDALTMKELTIPDRPWSRPSPLLASGQQPALTRQVESSRFVSPEQAETGNASPVRGPSHAVGWGQ